jgi:MauM/NapG family ferredoxin protein
MSPVDARIVRRGVLTGIERWILFKKIIQAIAFVAFLTLIILSRRAAVSPEWINLPLRLDPLIVFSAALSSKTFLSGSAVALIIVLLTLVAGRAFCGWLCPLGTLLDVFSFPRVRRGEKVPPETWRSVKYGLLLFILIAALFGNLTLLILDPLTILYRSFTLALLPAVDHIVTSIETALYPVPFLTRSVITFDRWIRPAVLPYEPVYYPQAFLFGFLLVGIILLNRAAPRFWCRYLCPLGGLLGVISRFSLFRRRVDSECRQCGVCDQKCPTGTIDRQRDYASDPAECTLCLDCFRSCPRGSLNLSTHLQPAPRMEYDPNRRHALAILGLSVMSVALLNRSANVKHPHKFLLRPPGAQESELMQTCVRCGACIAACPTGALQPAISEAGLEGIWTPVVVPRMGYCDYSCSACGSVCPVAAIPPLSLDEKRTEVIGKAYIDENRCLAWSNLEDCIICEEMCPVPNKAIHLESTEVTGEASQTVTVLLPYVERQRCIGCGICENKCPVGGESAIRVFINSENSN